METLKEILNVVGNLGPVVTAFAVVIAYKALRANHKTLWANHDWNRRHFAAQMIANWNRQTKPFIDDIEKIEPGIIDFGKDKKLIQITQREAEAIYFSRYAENSRNGNSERASFIC